MALECDELKPTGTEFKVCVDIAKRQAHGLNKYGVTVADNPLSELQWLQHFYEELLDAAVYTKRLIDLKTNACKESKGQSGS